MPKISENPYLYPASTPLGEGAARPAQSRNSRQNLSSSTSLEPLNRRSSGSESLGMRSKVNLRGGGSDNSVKKSRSSVTGYKTSKGVPCNKDGTEVVFIDKTSFSGYRNINGEPCDRDGQKKFREDQLARSRQDFSDVEDTGIKHLRLQGGSDVFEQAGIHGMNTRYGDKEMHVLRVPLSQYQPPHMAGGAKEYSTLDMDGGELKNELLSDRSDPASQQQPVAYITGSYHNAFRDYATLPEHSAIGKNTVTGRDDVPPYVPVDPEYKSDFHQVKFPDKSVLTTAPLLSDTRFMSNKSVNKFDLEKASKEKYQFQVGRGPIKPGSLRHAQHPNARSIINLPQSLTHPHADDAVHMAVMVDNSSRRGETARGATMNEAGEIGSWMAGFNRNPGPTYNLDGGVPSTMGVITGDGRKAVEILGQPDTHPRPANFVAMEHKPSEESE